MATLFAAYGLQVRVSDPRPDLAESVQATVRQFSQTLPGGPREADELLGRIEIEPDLERAVAGVAIVQENASGGPGLQAGAVRADRAGRAAGGAAAVLDVACDLIVAARDSSFGLPGSLAASWPPRAVCSGYRACCPGVAPWS